MATNIQKMRALIPDNEQIFDGDYLFSDNDLNAYLEVANNSVLRAASYAVLAIANSEAIISKIIKTQDLSTNGAAVADALARLAADPALRDQLSMNSKLMPSDTMHGVATVLEMIRAEAQGQ